VNNSKQTAAVGRRVEGRVAARAPWVAGATMCLAALCGCGDRSAPARAGQVLASVNGEEITVLQLNDELQRANVQAAQHETAGRQLLEALIDRQLLRNEAARDKTDRDPKVIQAIERAKALIIAQAYLQKKVGTVARPSAAEVSDYYARHPDFFAQRKQFDMHQLIIDSKDLSEPLKKVADNSRSLDEVAAWLDANKVAYQRAQSSRTSADLAPELVARLKALARDRLFVVREGERSMLVSIADVRDNAATLAMAAPQIEKFLIAKKSKDAADAELRHLRGVATIAYLNKPVAAAPAGPVPAATPPVSAPSDAATARGVAGLK
jgi:peptidyl-prolyl cis-trans isomerase C